MKRFCKHCGKDFDGRRQQWYCSDQCRKAATLQHRREKRGLTPRLCEVCSKEFYPRNSGQMMCSDACRKAKRDAMRPVFSRVCPWCGVSFETENPKRAFCCFACRKKYGSKQAAAERAPRLCEECGAEFVPRNIKSRFCSRACGYKHALRSDIPKGDAALERPYTEDTVWLVCKWYEEGDSVELIARMLFRSEENILQALRTGGVIS